MLGLWWLMARYKRSYKSSEEKYPCLPLFTITCYVSCPSKLFLSTFSVLLYFFILVYFYLSIFFFINLQVVSLSEFEIETPGQIGYMYKVHTMFRDFKNSKVNFVVRLFVFFAKYMKKAKWCTTGSFFFWPKSYPQYP